MFLLKSSLFSIAFLSLLLVACGDADKPAAQKSSPGPSVKPKEKVVMYERQFDMSQIVRGGQIFKQNCASCHGDNAEGANDWRKRDAQGKLPAPPLNGTGHAWHHPMRALKQTIYYGTARIGGSMPGWKDKLSEAQVDDILAWLQAKWPDEVYQAWARNDLRSRNQSTK
jgi:mono/diheme cytochrome c family protein